MVLPEYLIEKLEAIARREHRTPADVLESLLENYEPDADVREVRQAIYKRARDYWQKVGDEARLALSDVELDEQFWFIDADGIPHLKSDDVELPDDPLLKMAEMALEANLLFVDSADISERSREILETEYADYIYRRMNRDNVE